MIDYLGYNLTDYKDFRSLQLQYIKAQTLNQSLKVQIDTLKQAYDKKCSQMLQIKNEEMKEKIKIQNHNLKYKKLYKQLLQHIQSSLSCFKNSKPSQKNSKLSPQNKEQMNKSQNNQLNTNKTHISEQPSINQSIMNTSQNDKSIFIHLQQSQNLQKVCKQLSQMTKQYQATKQKNINLTKRIQTFETLYKSESFEKEKTEMMIVKQVQHLENQLEELNQVNIELEAKLSIKDKERRKIDIELKHFRQYNSELQNKIAHLITEKEQKNQQDNQFAIDFMTFQIHSIQSIFTRITEQTKFSNDLSNLLSILYSDYEELSEIFREKLQIEYDLEELEQRYKSQKSSSTADEALLIETRRQIEAFRLQLLKQKEVFRQKEQYIEEHFEEYNKINQQQLKIKNYSYELENKLYKQKRSGIQTSERFMTTRNPTARQILLKRTIDIENPSQSNTYNKNINSCAKDFIKYNVQEQTVDKEDSSSMPSKKTSLRFKQTHNAEQIMNEIIKKDKANMEKILKETRKTTIPIYLGK